MSQTKSETQSADGVKTGLVAQLFDLTVSIVFLCLCMQVYAFMFGWFAKNSTVYLLKTDAFIHMDFINSYMMGKMALSDQSHLIYDAKVQLEWYNKVIYPAKVNSPCFSQYPPFYPVLFSVFTLLPMREAFILWNVLTISMGSAAMLLANTRKLLTVGGVVVVILGLIASFPSCDSAMNGEMTWFFLALFLIYHFAFVRRRDIVGGIALGLMTLKPHFFLIILIPAMMAVRKKLLIAGFLTTVLMLVCAGFMIGFENIWNYPNVLLNAESTNVTSNLFPERMVCFRGVASVFLPRAVALKVGFAGFLLGLAIIVAIWFRCLRQQKMSIEWAAALSMLCLLITSPHMHVYDCVLIALSAILTLPTIQPSKILAVQPLSFRAWCIMLALYPVVSWFMLVAVPPVAAAILPPAVVAMTSVNDLKCGLMSFYVLMIFHIVLFACGAFYAWTHNTLALQTARCETE